MSVPPPGIALALEAPRPNPTRGEWSFAATLPGDDPARLDLFDIAGRRVWSATVRGGGRQVVRVAPSLRAGVYLARLTQGAHAVPRQATRLP